MYLLIVKKSPGFVLYGQLLLEWDNIKVTAMLFNKLMTCQDYNYYYKAHGQVEIEETEH